jgi:hypothetical protein
MHELFTGQAKRDDKQNFYSELLHYARQRNYNPYWAGHKYKEKFGVWPRGLDEATRPTSLATANWIKSRNIAWAKARSKFK